MPLRWRGENGQFLSNFEADQLDGIETPLPISDKDFETASERDSAAKYKDKTSETETARECGDRDTKDMGDKLRRTRVSKLPKIKDSKNHLKPANFEYKQLDYDNIKD